MCHTQGVVVLQALGTFLQQPELLQEWHERLKGVADLEGLHGALLGLEACLAKAGESQHAGTHIYIPACSWPGWGEQFEALCGARASMQARTSTLLLALGR